MRPPLLQAELLLDGFGSTLLQILVMHRQDRSFSIEPDLEMGTFRGFKGRIQAGQSSLELAAPHGFSV
jgi:hypothetical protein